VNLLNNLLPQVLPGPQLRGPQQDAQGQAQKVLTEGTLAAPAAAASIQCFMVTGLACPIVSASTKLLTRSAVPYACNQQSNSLQLSDFLHAGFFIIVLWLLLLFLSLLLS